jgi:uridine kinase
LSVGSRAEVVGELARHIAQRASRASGHPLRVAITGITASGKSTLALELQVSIANRGRPCARLAVDGFHNPRAIRYRRGRDSAEGYYRDAYDYDALVRRALIPLGPGGDRRYVERVLDLASDAPVEDAPITAPADGVVLLEGSFLLRPEIRDHFDYRVFVHVSFEAAEARGVERDAPDLGGPVEAARLYRQRYHAAQRLHLAAADPLRCADALFVNEELDAPTLFLNSRA